MSGSGGWCGRQWFSPEPGQVTLTDRIDRLRHPSAVGNVDPAGCAGAALLADLCLRARRCRPGWKQTWSQAGGVWVSNAAGRRAGLAGGLLVHGVIAGVGTVLTLLPILLIFFSGLGLLEDVGYMARAAYVMDRYMHPMGLHGKSFLPLFLGFGCNVPAVMASARSSNLPRHA